MADTDTQISSLYAGVVANHDRTITGISGMYASVVVSAVTEVKRPTQISVNHV